MVFVVTIVDEMNSDDPKDWRVDFVQPIYWWLKLKYFAYNKPPKLDQSIPNRVVVIGKKL